MTNTSFYPIGTPGQPWGPAEKSAWLRQLKVQRSYEADVVRKIEALAARFDVFSYAEIRYPPQVFSVYAIRNKNWRPELPCILVTGGVHGYETSGVHGALLFADKFAQSFEERANLLIAPCISPWGYEMIHRWNRDAIDPNRSFVADSPAQESAALMRLVEQTGATFLLHIDLHETTDTDGTEFRPALAARDGAAFIPGEIPDGFYLVGDTENPQPEFQQAIIAAVEKITHIAPADAKGELIGSPMVARGVINYPLKRLGLCASVTQARYTTTTEVYPDSPRASAQQCNDAQAAAVCAAIEFVLAHASEGVS